MVEFQSPRFAGDALLLDILNDPDTGTMKLGPGSPPSSVATLQDALFDLMWNLRTSEPVIHDRSEFVVGIYGPKTTQAVTAFKTRYGIHFPSDPTAAIDGFAGPRTLARLDQTCVILDKCIERIATKANELISRGVDVTFDENARLTLPFDGTSGSFSPAQIAGTDGAIFFKNHLGEANEVHGAIYQHYLQTFVQGPLGFPITDEEDLIDLQGFRISHFEHGRIRIDMTTGVIDQLVSSPPEPETDPAF